MRLMSSRLRAGLMSAAVSLLAASAALAADYNEAPALKAQVDAGALPPVAERLPAQPLVVTPLEHVGTYGGYWKATMNGASDHFWLIKTVGFENLLAYDIDTGRIVPNLAESFSANADATEFTVKIRDGLKWSDGQPFGADDILFWYEDVFKDTTLTPSVPDWLKTASGPVEVIKDDERTVRFVFKEPNGFFLLRFGAWTNGGDFQAIEAYPRHYLGALLPKYNEKADEEAKAAGFLDWSDRFTQLTGNLTRWRFAGVPTMRPWVLTDPYDDSPRVVAERNPYYFKVDTEGNQLPYLDGYDFTVVEDSEAMVLKALAGEIDFQDRTLAVPKNKAVLFDGREQAGFDFVDVAQTHMNEMIFYFNLNHRDPAKRELFQNRDFRVALSLATNRQEIIDLVYFGMGEPWQTAPRPDGEFSDAEMAKQYSEFDPAKANELLDAIGLDKRDGDNYRLMPDGSRVGIVVEVPSDFRPDWTDVTELLKTQWQDVGVDLQIRSQGRQLIRTHQLANEAEAWVFLGDGGTGSDLLVAPLNYLPIDTTGYRSFALLWSNWGNGLEPAEEPPAEVKRQIELYKEISATADPAVQVAKMREILAIAKEQFYNFGISLHSDSFGIKKTNFHNVPQRFYNLAAAAYIGVLHPEQFFKN